VLKCMRITRANQGSREAETGIRDLNIAVKTPSLATMKADLLTTPGVWILEDHCCLEHFPKSL
jgi:hypothetical protein